MVKIDIGFTTMLQHMREETKSIVDLASVFTVLGTLLEWLPHVAAFFYNSVDRYPYLGNQYSSGMAE